MLNSTREKEKRRERKGEEGIIDGGRSVECLIYAEKEKGEEKSAKKFFAGSPFPWHETADLDFTSPSSQNIRGRN